MNTNGVELRDHYDVVCVGGALTGSAVAHFLTRSPEFDGSVLVVEPDPTYVDAQSSRSSNSIREQFSHPLNVRISQFCMEFLADFRSYVEVDGDVPSLEFTASGYLFLASEPGHLDRLRAEHDMQRIEGADVRMLTPEETAAEFPYLDVERLVGARAGSRREGSIDGWALLEGMRRRAVHDGATYVRDRVVGMECAGDRVARVQLASGRSLSCGSVVNAAGTRASQVAAMAGVSLPVEARSRTTFVFDCRTSIDHIVPLTVTPQGVHFRRERQHYMTGAVPVVDVAVDPGDLAPRDDEFEDIIWPVLAAWVPQFDRVSVVASWGGHYAYNVLDHNVVVGPAPSVPNLYFANGYSGHGLQQAPAVGRGISELIVHGGYRTLDLSPFGYERVAAGRPLMESAVI